MSITVGRRGVDFLNAIRLIITVTALVLAALPSRASARGSINLPSYRWRTVTPSPAPPLFYGATGIAVGSSGNVFVADSGDHRIEKFSPLGVPLAVWGIDTAGPLHLDGPRAIAVGVDGTVYAADRGVITLSYTGRFLARWTAGALGSAQGLAVDRHRNLYVLSLHPVPHSSGFDRVSITKLSRTGTLLRSVSYAYDQQFGALGAAIAVAPNDNLLLSLKLQRHCHDCDGTYYLLRTISPAGQIVSDVGEDAGGTSVSVANARGEIYVSAPHRIERLSPSGVRLQSFGAAGCSATELGADLRVVVSPVGPVYVADSQLAAVRPDTYPSTRRDGVLHRFAPDGTNPALYGTCPPPGARTLFGQINGLAIGAGGRLFVADGITSTIDRVGPSGDITGVFSANHPSAVATDPQGRYYVTDAQTDAIEQHAPDGHLLTTSSAPLVEATAIAPDGNIYALTAFGDVLVLPPVGHGNTPLRRWRLVGYAGNGGGLSPSGICLDGAGNVWVTDTRHNNIQMFSPSGRLLLIWGRGGSGEYRFQNPSGLTVDGRGHLFVLDSGNNRVQEYDLRGRFIATFGREGQAPGQLRAPAGIGADRGGAIYVGDRGNDRIQQLVIR